MTLERLRRTSWHLPVVTCAGLLTGFVGLRWVVAAHGQISRFAVAGSSFANSHRVPKFLYVFQNSTGYDGQFYWRLAADPTNLHSAPHLGISLDSAARLNRMVYPVAAWLLAGGHRSFISWTLVFVNVIALLVLVRLGFAVALENDQSPWWGLLLLAVPGLVGALSRDLPEVLSVTLFIGGFVLARHQRWVWVGIVWAFALLTREPLLFPVFVYGAVLVITNIRDPKNLRKVSPAWLIPLVALLGWQIFLYSVIHRMPLFDAAGGNLGLPFVGVFSSVVDWFRPFGAHQMVKGLIIVAQVLGLLVLSIFGWKRRPRKRPEEVGAFIASLALVVCETRNGWHAPFDLRYGVDVTVLAWLFLLEGQSTEDRKRAAIVGIPVVLLTVLLRIIVI